MKALICGEFGPPEALVLRDVPMPVAGEGEVLIRIASSGLNFPDSLIIQDNYQIKAPLPFAPGGELAGTVESVGSGVSRFKAGARVAALTHWGGFAEYVVARESTVTHVPETMDLETASAFSLVYGTAHHALKQRGQIQPGETVLVLGASGGVGLAAVIAAASSDEKLDVCRLAGAHHSVNYSTDDLRARLRTIAPDGIDVVIDPVGGAMAEKALRALRWRGRFVTVGFASGDIPRIPLNLVLLKGCVVRGFEIRTFGDFEPELAARDKAELTALLADGLIDPHVSAVYPLEGVSDALRHVADRRSTGKVLVDCRSAT